FIRHFYMREIGFETEGLFKFYLETWLLVHMPYYNQLFKSELIEYDPLSNSQVIVAHEQLKDRGHVEERNSNRRDEGKSKNIAKLLIKQIVIVSPFTILFQGMLVVITLIVDYSCKRNRVKVLLNTLVK